MLVGFFRIHVDFDFNGFAHATTIARSDFEGEAAAVFSNRWPHGPEVSGFAVEMEEGSSGTSDDLPVGYRFAIGVSRFDAAGVLEDARLDVKGLVGGDNGEVVVEKATGKFDEGRRVELVGMAAVVVAIADVSVDVGGFDLRLFVVNHNARESEEFVDWRGVASSEIHAPWVGPTVVVASVYEDGTRSAEGQDGVGVDGKEFDFSWEVAARDEFALVLHEVTRHPVVFLIPDGMLEVLTPVATGRLGAQATRAARIGDGEARLESHSDEGCLAEARVTRDSKAGGVHVFVGFEVIDQTADAPGPGHDGTHVVRLAPVSFVEQTDEVAVHEVATCLELEAVREVEDEIRLERVDANGARAPAFWSGVAPPCVREGRSEEAPVDVDDRRNGTFGVERSSQDSRDGGSVLKIWIRGGIDDASDDFFPIRDVGVGDDVFDDFESNLRRFFGEEAVKFALSVGSDFRTSLGPPLSWSMDTVRLAVPASPIRAEPAMPGAPLDVHFEEVDWGVVTQKVGVGAREVSLLGVVVVGPETVSRSRDEVTLVTSPVALRVFRIFRIKARRVVIEIDEF